MRVGGASVCGAGLSTGVAPELFLCDATCVVAAVLLFGCFGAPVYINFSLPPPCDGVAPKRLPNLELPVLAPLKKSFSSSETKDICECFFYGCTFSHSFC
eukprot:TRINITY_DN17829_c0_g1_i1.p1 TRINITY_DN17829_c0_g1~~TRINITY_DN17829_c0_g1_i1.p1  ORF type:complete len:100 (+),score=8.90 TRINITY_DN17829_c0_g1_i1:32-331(+)